MNQFGFNPYMYEEIKRQHEQLIKESTLLQKVKEIREGDNFTPNNGFNLFAVIGRELSRIGFSLEMRYGSQPEVQALLNRQGNTGDCG